MINESFRKLKSQDLLAANNWNVCQYAALVHMFAQVSNLKVGELVHVIADAHIYDRHVPIIKELISRPTSPAPMLQINDRVDDFYQFRDFDFNLLFNASTHIQNPQIKNIPIAI
jgi:thymidylate synthase